MKALVASVALLVVVALAAMGPSEAVPPTKTSVTQLAGIVITLDIGPVLSGVGACPPTTSKECPTLSDSDRNQDSVGVSSVSSPIASTLPTASSTTTGITTFTVNLSGANVAAPETLSGGCEGRMSDGTAPASSSSRCTLVPEPITMFLGGAGLLGLVWAWRRRLFRRLAS